MVVASFAFAFFAAAEAELVSFSVLLFAARVRAAAAFVVPDNCFAVDDDFFDCISVEIVIVLFQKLFSFL